MRRDDALPRRAAKLARRGRADGRTWDKQTDAFDANALAEQVVSTGAKRLLFAIGQNSVFRIRGLAGPIWEETGTG